MLHRPHQGWGEQRTLAANTIAALLIAVVGLLAAGNLPLTTPADAGTARTTATRRTTEDPAAAGRRSAALQAALLAEVAAQRADALAKDAQLVARTSLSAAGSARQQQLTAVQAATQAAAVQLAEQIAQARLEAAIAARRAVLEEAARAAQAAADQAAADQAGTTLPGTTQSDPTLGGQATTPVTGTAGTLPSGTRGTLPISTGVVGSPFGARGIWARYHTGLDFRAAYGTPIHAVLPGRVVFAGSTGDWAGNHVAVRHADGRTTMYSHMSQVAVTAGQTVQVGQVLGHVGQTGRAFGAHLHFELYPPGVRYGDIYRAVDPTPWLRSIGVRTH